MIPRTPTLSPVHDGGFRREANDPQHDRFAAPGVLEEWIYSMQSRRPSAQRARKPTVSNYPTGLLMTRLPDAGFAERISDGGAI